MKTQEIDFEQELKLIFEKLIDEPSNHIIKEYGIVPPYQGNSDIKLVIIGQDPTIRNEEQRKNIACTLNLDKAGSLTRYVEQICEGLGIAIKNVYATNVFKYFYSNPPADTFDVLKKHLDPNLQLLNKELSTIPDVPIITLGEPVLRLLTGNDKAEVSDYWGYDPKTRTRNGAFKYSKADENKLNRAFFPFCHITSYNTKVFYKGTLKEYINYVKRMSGV